MSIEILKRVQDAGDKSLRVVLSEKSIEALRELIKEIQVKPQPEVKPQVETQPKPKGLFTRIKDKII